MARIQPIGQNADYKMVDTWNTEGLGLVHIYHCLSRNQFVLHKQCSLHQKFGASAAEIHLVELRIKELPEEVTLASSDYSSYDPLGPLILPENPANDLYLDYSAVNLRRQLLQMRESGQRFSDTEALGYLGFLIGLGSYMEQGLEFHRSVCMKNLLVIEGQTQLMNPYISDNHISLVLSEFVKPIISLGAAWLPELYLDDKLRRQVSQSNPQIRQINELHLAYVRQMFVDCCLVFLGVANMQDDSIYLRDDGNPNFPEIERAVKGIEGRFDPEVIELVKKVVFGRPETRPTFIEVNETMSASLRDTFLDSIANSGVIRPKVDEGHWLPHPHNPGIDLGQFDPSGNIHYHNTLLGQRKLDGGELNWNIEETNHNGYQQTAYKQQLQSTTKTDNILSARSFGSQSNFMNKDSLMYSAGDDERTVNRDSSIKKQIFGDIQINQVGLSEEIRRANQAQHIAYPIFVTGQENTQIGQSESRQRLFSQESISTIGQLQRTSNQWSTNGKPFEPVISGNRMDSGQQKTGVLSQQILHDQNRNMSRPTGGSEFESPGRQAELGEYLRSVVNGEYETELEYSLKEKPKKDSIKQSSNRIVLQQDPVPKTVPPRVEPVMPSHQPKTQQLEKSSEKKPQFPPQAPSSRRQPEVSSLMKEKAQRVSNNSNTQNTPTYPIQSTSPLPQVVPEALPENRPIPNRSLYPEQVQAPSTQLQHNTQIASYPLGMQQVVQPVIPPQPDHRPMLQGPNLQPRSHVSPQQRTSEVRRQPEIPVHSVPLLAGKPNPAPTSPVSHTQSAPHVQQIPSAKTLQSEVTSQQWKNTEPQIAHKSNEIPKTTNEVNLKGDLASIYASLRPGQVIYETADGTRKIVDEKDIPTLIQQRANNDKNKEGPEVSPYSQATQVQEITIPVTKSAGQKAKSVSPIVQAESQDQVSSPTTHQSPVHNPPNHINPSPRIGASENQVIVENRPYIFDENGNKVYVDPNNLSAFAKIARKAPPGALNNTTQHVTLPTLQVGPNHVENAPITHHIPENQTRRHIFMENVPIGPHHIVSGLALEKEGRKKSSHRSKGSKSSRNRSSRSHKPRSDEIHPVETHQYHTGQARYEDYPTYYPQQNYTHIPGMLQFNPINIKDTEYYSRDRSVGRGYAREEYPEEYMGESKSSSRHASRSRSKHRSSKHKSKREPTVIRPVHGNPVIGVPTEPIYHRPSPVVPPYPSTQTPPGYVPYTSSAYTSRGAADFDYSSGPQRGFENDLPRSLFSSRPIDVSRPINAPPLPPSRSSRDPIAPTFIGSTIDETLERIMKKTFS